MSDYFPSHSTLMEQLDDLRAKLAEAEESSTHFNKLSGDLYNQIAAVMAKRDAALALADRLAEAQATAERCRAALAEWEKARKG